jgi:hypothetical protein
MMKAILEFELPRETEICQMSFHSAEAWACLREIAAEIRLAMKNDHDHTEALRQIRSMVDDALSVLGS